MKKIAKIVHNKKKNCWTVYSSKGKKLSKCYKTKKEAVKRLGQIEYFKQNSLDDLSIVDLADQSNYDIVLSNKPADGQYTTVQASNDFNKKAFGLTVPGFNESPGGIQNPNYDEEDPVGFFGAEEEQELEDSIPDKNMKYKKKLKEAATILNQYGFKKEAQGVLDLLLDMIDPVKSLDDETYDLPILGEVSNPFNVNQSNIFSQENILKQVYSKYKNERIYRASEYYNSFSNNNDALNAIVEESTATMQNHERAFGAFLYMMHNGVTCNSAINFGEEKKTVQDFMEEIFSLSDIVLSAGLIIGGGKISGGLLSIFKSENLLDFAKRLLLGSIGKSLILSGVFWGARNFSYSKLIPEICKDPKSFQFDKDNPGILKYSEPTIEIEKNQEQLYVTPEMEAEYEEMKKDKIEDPSYFRERRKKGLGRRRTRRR
jgi:hypothetical protein